jgi:hypothetical protein
MKDGTNAMRDAVRWLAVMVLVGGCDLEPEKAPRLHICTTAECVEQARTAGSEARSCETLEDIAPGAGFYAVHVVDDKITLDDATKGELEIETICGRKTYELKYSSPAGAAENRLAAVPIAAPPEAICGMTVRATLINHTDSCYRQIGPATAATEATGTTGGDEVDIGLVCAKLRDACAKEGDEAGTGTGTGGGSSTGGASDGSSGTAAGSTSSGTGDGAMGSTGASSSSG